MLLKCTGSLWEIHDVRVQTGAMSEQAPVFKFNIHCIQLHTDVFWCLFERIGHVIVNLCWKESDKWLLIYGPGAVVGALSVTAIALSILACDFIVSQSNHRNERSSGAF